MGGGATRRLVSAMQNEVLGARGRACGASIEGLTETVRRSLALNRNLRGVLCATLWMSLPVGGCASHHARDVQGGLDGDRLTVGTVQREVRKGMSGADVLTALGSPNIVSTDEQGREVWVYDRIGTDVVASESGWSVLGFGGGAGSGAACGGGVGLGGRTGAASTSQRTLTVIIKFDEGRAVRDFAYHTSRF